MGSNPGARPLQDAVPQLLVFRTVPYSSVLYSSFLVLILITRMLFLGTCASTPLAAVSA